MQHRNPPLASLAAPFSKGGSQPFAPFGKGGRLPRSGRRGDFLVAALLTLAATTAFADSLLPKKSGLPQFLPVDEAFEIQPLEWKDGRVEVSWRIAKGYYLYRDHLKFKPAAPASLKLEAPKLPVSVPHEDEHFGAMQVYRGKLVVALPMSKSAKGPVSIAVTYQGCADAGLCYPPQTRTLEAGRVND